VEPRIAGRLGPVVLVLAGCGEEPQPELVELQYGPKEDVRSRREQGEWVLEGPSESLRFFVGHIERDPSSPPRAESVPLADGGVLAALTITVSEGFDYETCYLQLEHAKDGWRPLQVGIYVASDIGLFWFEGLSGQVTVDSGTEGRILCRIELQSTEGVVRRTFKGDFLVDTSASSAALRDWLLRRKGTPALR